ncbi:hypothetical protein B0H19DRAFT_1253669 [Mycena capillaripes]|nr:hypothetical protein B0H19DRAFT_1253669 [Mycena capillaripes]
MASLPPLDAIPALDGSIGVTEIGSVLATFLYGIETLQTFNYYHQFHKDPWFLKTLVAVIWFLELGHTICTLHAVYSTTITFYGQLQYVFNPPRTLYLTIWLSSTINAVTFFAIRIRLLSKQWPVTILCCTLNVARLACNMGLIAVCWNSTSFLILETRLHKLMTAASSIGPCVDIIIATSLCYWLWRMRASNFKYTSTMVDTLIIWTVETTLITSLAGIMQLILFLTCPGDVSWIAFYLMQAKLFSNSLLASLNGRQRFRADTQPQTSGVVVVPTSESRSNGLVIGMVRMTETGQEATDPTGRSKNGEF